MNNEEKEMTWINAWSELEEICKNSQDIQFLLPDWTEISKEECKGWLQECAYDGYNLEVKEVLHKCKKFIQVSKYKGCK